MAPFYSCKECCVTNCSVAFIFRSDSVLYHYLLIFFSSLFCLHLLLFCLTGIWSCPKCFKTFDACEKDLDIWSCLKPFSMDKMCSWTFVTGQISRTFWVDSMSYIHFRQDQISANLNVMLDFSGYWNINPFFVIKINRKKRVGN